MVYVGLDLVATTDLVLIVIIIQVSLHFQSNKAIIGSAIYTDRLDLCSWNSYDPPFYDKKGSILRWPFVTYG